MWLPIYILHNNDSGSMELVDLFCFWCLWKSKLWTETLMRFGVVFWSWNQLPFTKVMEKMRIKILSKHWMSFVAPVPFPAIGTDKTRFDYFPYAERKCGPLHIFLFVHSYYWSPVYCSQDLTRCSILTGATWEVCSLRWRDKIFRRLWDGFQCRRWWKRLECVVAMM